MNYSARGRQTFVKPPLKAQALIDQLRLRGLSIPQSSEIFAKRELKNIGYYRLTGHMINFQQNTGINRHNFTPPCSIEDIVNAYNFDTEIRRHCLAALDDIEIAIKASICDTMCALKGAHWYQRRELFLGKHEELLNVFAKSAHYDRCQNRPHDHQPELYLKAYYEKYSSPQMPPAWMLRECATFGAWSRVFESLHSSFQNSIVNKWQFPNGSHFPSSVFGKWLLSTSMFRNKCAHHGRITGSKLPFSPPIPNSPYTNAFFTTDIHNLRTRFLLISVLLCTLGKHEQWLAGLNSIFEKYDPMLGNNFKRLTGLGTGARSSALPKSGQMTSTSWRLDTLWIYNQ